MTVTLDSLHADLLALSGEVGNIRSEITGIRHDLVRLEAKIDGKPSLMAMFTGIVVVVFGMAGVIGSTVAVLAETHFLR